MAPAPTPHGPAFFFNNRKTRAMALQLTSGPALEPVTVSEAKTHARIDTESEDVLIASLILTSRLHIEAALGIALITQSWTASLDQWPRKGIVDLPLQPVQSISAVRLLGNGEDVSVIDSNSYRLDKAATPARLIPVHGQWPPPARPKAGIEIAFTAGFGDTAADVPQTIRHALLCLVAHWYEHRDPFQMGPRDTAIPKAVGELLTPYQVPRL